MFLFLIKFRVTTIGRALLVLRITPERRRRQDSRAHEDAFIISGSGNRVEDVVVFVFSSAVLLPGIFLS